MICLNCGSEFEAKRSSAKYCSGGCKKAFQRRVDKVSGTEEISGTDIPHTFENLPKDVQESIEYMSCRDGFGYEEEKALRTQRAWGYLGKFPNRFRRHVA